MAVIGLITDQSVGSMPWSPLAASLATRPWGDRSTTRGAENLTVDISERRLFQDSDKAIVDAVERIASAQGVSMATVAMAWALRHPGVIFPIIDATRPEHLADAVAAFDLVLDDEEVSALDKPYTSREPTCF